MHAVQNVESLYIFMPLGFTHNAIQFLNLEPLQMDKIYKEYKRRCQS
ncbi:hypothetical protein CAEBREN_05446 [Caenorhabditis brenneri]|uniref:Uncharacterized protein n=1 Tax=Caenorhabditis brenneri TaxID=135651 RepID=G0NJX6_CAEBE|nr:hypothetical protein CAEBREN_05446 [Caenorhabditis brenneri]